MKATLKNITLEFSRDKNYFSLKQIKEYLLSNNFNYADVSIKKSLSQLIDEKIIFSAGRGYYSNISSELQLDSSPVDPIAKIVKQKFPLLQFSVWSTQQITFAFHHLQNKFFTFIYAEKDSLIYLRDNLIENGYSVFLNPTKNDLDKTTFTSENSIILRQYVARSISKDHIASIEKIIVDLFLEAERLNFIDNSEYYGVLGYFMNNSRLNISVLLDYAERRKILTKIKQLLIKYTNPTFV